MKGFMERVGLEEIEEISRRIATAVQKAVTPHLGTSRAKCISGSGASGDVTFGIDVVAEQAVESAIEDIPDIAYYTEDKGLLERGNPSFLLVIDPIDGTRPAAAGLEACCVTVAAASFEERRVYEMGLGEVTFGFVKEIKTGREYLARKGEKVRIVGNDDSRVALSETKDISRIFWTTGFRGRPAFALCVVLEELIDASSVDGACFDVGSAAFGIVRVVTGEMDAYVDVGQRIYEDIPALRERFLELGHGSILNNYSYDVAAAALIASECGAIVTDARGEDLSGYPLVPSLRGGQISIVVSSNRELHELILESIDRGIDKLKKRYS